MNLRQQSILIGAILGAGLGALGGYLFVRGLDESGEGEESLAVAARSVQAGDMIKLIIAIMGVLRGVSVLRDAG
jgi:NhaP-type Na+/H+ or K+/H+ antiporter